MQPRGMGVVTSVPSKEVCCSVLQCVAVCCRFWYGCSNECSLVRDVCVLLQCVAVWCSVLQCVAVCCSVLQFVAL